MQVVLLAPHALEPRLEALVLVVACGLTSASATSWDYTISVPDGREAKFELPFPVEYAGSVTIEASWIGPRLLSSLNAK